MPRIILEKTEVEEGVEKRCPRCDAVFKCSSDESCWCFRVDKIYPVPPPGSVCLCFCPLCLDSTIK